MHPRLLICLLLLVPTWCTAQCLNAVVADSSFEDGTWDSMQGVGGWLRNDGADTSNAQAWHGNNSICSNAGGGDQWIPVQSNTPYFFSCYVKNGVNDPFFFLGAGSYITNTPPNSNDWTLMVLPFVSGNDTTTLIRFYSSGACFDYFRVTCDSPVTALPPSPDPFFNLPSTVSTAGFSFSDPNIRSVRVYDTNGRHRYDRTGTQHRFGQNWPPGCYILTVTGRGGILRKKLLKIQP